MSNRRSTQLKPHCTCPSLLRVYVAEEQGALLVRHGHPVTSLKKALGVVERFAPAICWEIREFKNGCEKLLRNGVVL